MSYKDRDQKIDQTTVRKIFNYLFGKGDMSDSQHLDMRTRIKGREMFGALVFFRVLDEHFDCKTAKKVANILERMSVSDSGMGRLEGVTVLSAPTLPKEIQILRGIDPMLKQGKK